MRTLIGSARTHASRRNVAAITAALFASLITTLVSAKTTTVRNSTELNAAMAAAVPGDTIILSGTINGSLKTAVDGTSSAPITVKGDGTAILNGTNSGYGIECRHDYYQFQDIIVQNFSKGFVADDADHGWLDRVHVKNTQQESVKFRNKSRFWLVTYCSARNTGLQGKFGEGFYVGQAYSNWIVDPRYNDPAKKIVDGSGNITFFKCYATDTVNDGWDCKEGADNIKIINCTADYSGPIEPNGAGGVGENGWYIRSNDVQVVKCSAIDFGAAKATFQFEDEVHTDSSNNTRTWGVNNELKQCQVVRGNGPVVDESGGSKPVYYSDNIAGPGGVGNLTTAPVSGGFQENFWTGEGGALYAGLDNSIGAEDPLDLTGPVASPKAGTYSSAQTVKLSTNDSTATIRYTLDGSTPTASSTVYTSAGIPITSTKTIKAIAFKNGYTTSNATSNTYTITSGGVTVTSAQSFYNQPMPSTQSGTFTLQFDATPSAVGDTTIGLCSGDQSAYTGLAVIVRFNTLGKIDARNGGAYAASTAISYTGGVKYSFRLVVNVPAHTYSAYVTPAGGTEKLIGSNYAFRTEQASVTSLNRMNINVTSGSIVIGPQSITP
jgi:hypothetical protein